MVTCNELGSADDTGIGSAITFNDAELIECHAFKAAEVPENNKKIRTNYLVHVSPPTRLHLLESSILENCRRAR